MADQRIGVMIGDVIRRLLPEGSTAPLKTSDGSIPPPDWKSVCIWPPDLFAVVASIAHVSGLYSEPTFAAYWHVDFCLDDDWRKGVCAVGKGWRNHGGPPCKVNALWFELVQHYWTARVVRDDEEDDASALRWKRIVFQLLSIADEACAGIGFALPAGNEVPPVLQFYNNDYVRWEERRAKKRGALGGKFLKFLPLSLCQRVPPDVACVQPKSATPSVGCTLRSLTHHVALLPPVGHVTTHWLIANRAKDNVGPFNMLLVPFPYCLPGNSFSEATGHFPGESADRTFTLDPDAWRGGASAADFAEFVSNLIQAARAEMKSIHAVVLPETALRVPFANEVAKCLAHKEDLELFITGAVGAEGKTPRNVAAMFRFSARQVSERSFQSKHHRWRLDHGQITRYNLGQILDPHRRYWERIDVSDRNCYVTNFRGGAALSVLVCEDLARYDPVLTVMNAIGPNLVVALLMDGPQLEKRWPGRYATVLAEDPGSAVLTLTSLGMVLRSSMPGDTPAREIGLWKEPDGMTRELKLPQGHHALALSLTTRLAEQVTLDGRSDGTQTVNFVLGAACGIKLTKPPAWLQVAP